MRLGEIGITSCDVLPKMTLRMNVTGIRTVGHGEPDPLWLCHSLLRSWLGHSLFLDPTTALESNYQFYWVNLWNTARTVFLSLLYQTTKLI